MSLRPFSRLVDLIYSAACDPDRWPHFLQALSESLSGNGADLIVGSGGGAITIQHGVGIFGAEFRLGYQDVHASDPFYVGGLTRGRLRAGLVTSGAEVVSRAELERTAFHQEFGRHHDYYGGVVAVLEAGAAGFAALAVNVGRHQVMDASAHDLMQSLTPHVQRAIRVHRQLIEGESRSKELDVIIDRLNSGAMVVDSRGRVIRANECAQRLLETRDGLVLDREQLRACWPRDTRALRCAIAAATSDDLSPRSGSILKLHRPSHKSPLQIVISTIPGNRDKLSGNTLRALLLVTDPGRPRQINSTLLSQLYGLTAAESRVAICFVEGKSVREIAQLLDVSVNTVRFHLRQLFAKTGTRRQAELVRRLSEAGGLM